jgi:ABC-2 type transport system ATP-binding protein
MRRSPRPPAGRLPLVRSYTWGVSAPVSPAAGATRPAVEIDGLVMRYGEKVAVDGLSLTVGQGTITAVLGPNGAGKTTTLETAEGYRAPQAGRVRVLGLDPVRDRHDLLPRIGVMLQGGGAWSGVHADEMLRHIARLHAHPLDLDLLSERLGLGDCGRTPYRRLSGGQQQRLGLAMAVVGRPEIVFVDEPTAGMDPAARRTTWELLEELRSSGVTVVLTTHYMEEAERLADRIHIIDHGRLIASGSPLELTRGGRAATIRLVVTRPFPPDSPQSLRRALGDRVDVTLLDEVSIVVTGPADAHSLAIVSRWCEENDVLPESLTLGQRTLEDVFLELTGRTITA